MPCSEKSTVERITLVHRFGEVFEQGHLLGIQLVRMKPLSVSSVTPIGNRSGHDSRQD